MDCIDSGATRLNPARRHLVRLLGAGGVVLALAPAALVEAAVLPEAMDVRALTDLCERLTGTRPSAALAKRTLAALLAEPWGASHLQRLRVKQGSLLREGRWRLEALDEGERWFLSHLLTTLVTGVYFHERGNRALAWDDALMHAALADVRPVPLACTGRFGDWSRPPA
ncbi:MAG: sugar dehydrogenase complex small subunit [Mariprofundaceae bacterium]